MDMNKDNVILIEKHDNIINEAVKTDDGKNLFIHGFKIFRAVVPDENEENGFRTIAQYDFNESNTDLSEFKNYNGAYLVSVDRDDYNNDIFVWNVCRLYEGSEDNRVFAIRDHRPATDEEIVFLNETFPEYYDNAF